MHSSQNTERYLGRREYAEYEVDPKQLLARCGIVIGSLFYALLLLWVYKDIISPYYAYMGMHYTPRSTMDVVSSVAFAVSPALWLHIKTTRPSSLVYSFVYYLLYIPSCIVPPLILGTSVGNHMPYQIMSLISMTILGFGYTVPLKVINRLRLKEKVYWQAVFGWTAFTFFLVALNFNITTLKIPSWGLEFYEVRSVYKETIRKSNIFVSYMIMWQCKVISPLLFLYGLKSRINIHVIAAVGFQCLLFLITGVKTVLFSMILIAGIYLLLARLQRGVLFGVFFGVIITVAGCALIDIWIYVDVPIFSSLFTRRIIFIPGLLTSYYYDFFSENPKLYLADTLFLRYLVDSPYQTSVAKTIGLKYFGSYEASANANFLSDAYANIGLIGLPIYSGVLAGVLWLYDSLSIGTDRRIALALLTMPAMAIVNSGLLTVLLTHGLFIAIVAMYFYPTETKLSERLSEE